MLIDRPPRGFTLIEALVALALMLAGLAGASLVLLQSIQHERESSHRRAANRLAGSLAEELRAHHRGGDAPLPVDAPFIVEWIAAVESALPAGSMARVEVDGETPAAYRIAIEWPAAGVGSHRLLLPVTP
ncbi:MAG: prepilin-type N-terminal cleavage/methylation domain-containing protein [Steroidobacteraceae bacterium]